MKSICFVTTGDIKNLATAKRALGLANPLTELGWEVSIIMEDTEENRHRCKMECSEKVNLFFFPHCSCREEWRHKNRLIKQINPDFLYLCAFVIRNIVGIGHRSRKLVEHSELQTGIPDVKGIHRLYAYLYEYFSILYSDALLNASLYLQKVYKRRAARLLKGSMPMLYFPYAFNPDVVSQQVIDYSKDKFSRFAGKTNFVFLGTVTRNYGVFTILEAIEKLKERYSNFCVLILGRGRHYKESTEYVAKHGLEEYVFMPGFIEEEEISEYFSLASAFVSPMNDTVQDWARCPSKIYLYLPFHKPVITCQIGEPYEVLKGEGLYYATGDSQSMAQQMAEVIENNKSVCNVDPNDHSWETRGRELSDWLNKTF